MNWLDTFFVSPHSQLTYISGDYNYTLVVLSVIVAVTASFIALHFASMTKHILVVQQRHIAVFAGAIMMAGGVWSMHFVGMLAFNMGGEVDYDTTLTFLSILPSLIASYVTLRILIKSKLTSWQLVNSSLCVGAGIGIMHYTGMAAMEMEASLQYEPVLFVTSIIVAVILAFLALSVRYYLSQLSQGLSTNVINIISAVIMGIAISGMHYTGMAAARFGVLENGAVHDSLDGSASQLPYMIVFAVLLMSGLAATIASQLRYRQLLIEKTTNERRLQTMMETAVDGIFTIDARGIIQDFNQSASEIFGWQASDIIGQPFLRLVPDDATDEYRRYLSNFQQTGQTQISGQAREVFAKHKDGHTFPVRLGLGHVQSREMNSMFVGFVTDISERWEMQEKLRKSEEQYSSLIKNIPGASFRCLLDEHWTAVLVSEGIIDLCGWMPKDLYDGRVHFADLIHPDDVEKTEQAVQKALNDKTNYTVEFRWKHRDGHYIWVLENGSIIWDNDTPLWIDGLILNITERVEMEERLRQAKEEAELSAESKARFLANMSHEIRTPMNAIIGFTDLLVESNDMADDNKKHLNTISQSARSLLHLLNDVLDSAKLEKNKLELDQSAFDLTRLIDSVISTLWLQAKNKSLYLSFDMPDDIHPNYLGDENRLRQVLMNLLGNAIKFTEEGGVTLTISASSEQRIRFHIEDTGIGMDEATLDQVFAPFSQADASMSRRFGGTGLGTTISKQLVELMGGQLYARSERGVGSIFYFDIPLTRTTIATEPETEKITAALPPQTVLIADDIEQNLTLLSILLQRQHHRVIQAKDGQAALDLFKENQPDIVLMDLQMPVMDGFTATNLMRDYEAENSLDRTPVVALTASVLSEDRIEAKMAGMDGFAHKPIDITALTHEMGRVLGVTVQSRQALVTADESLQSPSGQVDLEQGVALWGDLSNYIKELKRFLSQFADIPDTLAKLCEADKYEQLGSESHRLKGLSGNLSLTAVYPLAMKLEQDASHNNSEKCQLVIHELRSAMSLLEEDVNEMAQTYTSDSPFSSNAARLGTQETLTLVAQLSESTSLGEINETTLDELIDGIDADLHSLAQEVKMAIDEFDFTTASKHLDAIKQQLTQS